MSEIILWRNGIEQSPDCSGGGSKPFVSILEAPDKKPGQVKISPNPANDILNIEYPASRMVGLLQIFDVQGGLLLNFETAAQTTQLSIPSAQLPKGVYFVKLYGECALAGSFIISR